MTRLRDLQLRFQDYLLGNSDDIEADIVGSRDALAEHRLGVYYNAYRIRLIDALAVDYPALEACLGRDDFEQMALDYLRAFPPTNPSVRWFGQHLPRHLAAESGDAQAEFLHELASYEWARTLVFDAADAPRLVQFEDIARLQPTDWPAIRFHFKPALRWIDLYWNVPQYEQAIAAQELPAERVRGEYPLRWLIWRQAMKIRWRSLEVHEAWALEQAADGADFAAICEGLLEWFDDSAAALAGAALLKQWVGDQLLLSLDPQKY